MKPEPVIEEQDILKAFSYVTQWRGYAMDVVSSIGLGVQERLLGVIHDAILRQPGIMRSSLMQTYHLTKRDAEGIFDTLEQRGQIERIKRGKSESYKPIGPGENDGDA
jgi:hypothetical protein